MLKKGIYENIINQEVERDIQEAESQQLVCLREQIDAAESPKILADYLAKAIRQKLEDTEDMHDRMTLVNRILAEYGLVEETGRMDAPGRPLLFGTTEGGQDILTCLASGARFSFLFAICVAAVNLFVGAIYGSIEGYYGGKIDLVMERVSDILASVPSVIVITLLQLHMQGASTILVLFLAFFITGWIGMASTTRMQFYRYKNQEYVLAARTLGAKNRRIIWKHIFPNALGTLVTSCALVIPSMIYSEVNLSYLGIINLSSGNLTSVGTLLANGQPVLTTYPHIIAFPSVFLALLLLSFNLFGNGLRDAFNPSLRGSED